MIDKKELDRLLINVLKKVKQEDSYLIDNDNHEISLEFRLAHHLANSIEKKYDYKIDIEYNRDKNVPKKIDSNIRPDIIIHKRGKKGPNISAIEIKKSTDSCEDKKKLLRIKEKYNYLYVYFINFNSNIEYFDESSNNWVILSGDNDE